AKNTARRTADELLELLALSERGSDRVESLSLGNQQRVQLAAALVHDPSLLVLDEPFSGLDPMGVDAMAAVLRARVDAGAAVVFSSHQLDLVERLCDGVGIIRSGRLVADGSVDQLLSRAQQRYRVGVDAAAGWPLQLSLHLPGADLVEDDGHTAVVELKSGDDQELLDAARALGPVRLFAPVRTSLTELFPEAVTGDGSAVLEESACTGARCRSARPPCSSPGASSGSASETARSSCPPPSRSASSPSWPCCRGSPTSVKTPSTWRCWATTPHCAQPSNSRPRSPTSTSRSSKPPMPTRPNSWRWTATSTPTSTATR